MEKVENMHSKWKDLVLKLINMNGEGKKELQGMVDAGEISEEDAAFICLKANTTRLLNKIEEISSPNFV